MPVGCVNRSVAANLPRRKAPPSPPAKAPTSPLTRRWTPRSTWPQATARRLPRPPRPPIPAGRQSSPQLPPPHPSLRPQCRPALRHPTPAWLPGRGRARCRSRGFAPRASATTRSRRRNPPTGPSRVRRLPAPVPPGPGFHVRAPRPAACRHAPVELSGVPVHHVLVRHDPGPARCARRWPFRRGRRQLPG